jgi:hypothetical protein
MGARLLSGGLRREAESGLGGATVMDSLTPKFQVTGDPGLDRTLLGTSPTTSWNNTDIKQAGRSVALRSSPCAGLACLVEGSQ